MEAGKGCVKRLTKSYAQVLMEAKQLEAKEEPCNDSQGKAQRKPRAIRNGTNCYFRTIVQPSIPQDRQEANKLENIFKTSYAANEAIPETTPFTGCEECKKRKRPMNVIYSHSKYGPDGRFMCNFIPRRRNMYVIPDSADNAPSEKPIAENPVTAYCEYCFVYRFSRMVYTSHKMFYEDGTIRCNNLKAKYNSFTYHSSWSNND